MQMIRLLLSIALMGMTLPAIAQQPAGDAGRGDLQASMSPSEFKAAGLDKLTPAELAALNAWLQRKVGQETAVAVAEARQAARVEVEQETRGFFDFGSDDPISSTIVGEFRGFASGRQYTLENGQVWEQVEAASLAGVRRTNPAVTITPSRFANKWFMKIEGYNTSAPVRRIK